MVPSTTSSNSTGFLQQPHHNRAGGGKTREGPAPKSARNVIIQPGTDNCSNITNNHTTDACDTETSQYSTIRNEPKTSMKKLKKQNVSTVFNYSSIELTEAMVALLNRGLIFAILPLKLDLTQVLVDFKRFERSII